MEEPKGIAGYSDADEIETWARQAINNYSVYGFVKGYGDGTLRPMQNVTRAEVVQLLNELYELIDTSN